MTTLNITYNGLSTDVALDLSNPTDERVKALAAEVLTPTRSDTFQHYVVDRFRAPGGEERIYLRPKVPFGA